MKKGFTLIELLAVILILGIIALIAIPIVTNIIDEAKENSIKVSAENYVRVVEDYAALQLLKENNISGNLDITSLNGLNIKGTLPKSGTVTIENNKVISCNLNYEGYIVTCSNNSINIRKYEPIMLTQDNFPVLPWDEILLSVRAKKYDDSLVGATKCISLNGFTTTNDNGCSNGEVLIRVSNISVPNECNNENFSQTACGFVLEFADIITKHAMNPTWTNVGGWKESEMRNYINTTIYEAIPNELKDNIIDTRVISGHGTSDEENFVTTDKLYLLSTADIFKNDNYIYTTAKLQTRQLDYYLGISANDYGLLPRKKIDNKFNSYWLRSSTIDNDTDFYKVSSNAGTSHSNAHGVDGVAPAFRIG